MQFTSYRSLAALFLVLAAPSAHAGVRVDIEAFNGFSAGDRAKAEAAITVIESVLGSEEFRQKVLNFTYNGRKQFVSTDKSNDEVYAMLMAGKETYSQEADGEMNLNLNLYAPPFYKRWSVVGYTYPNTNQIFVNRYYYGTFQPEQIAGNFTHEWCHKIGFDHDFKRTSRRPASVPYAIGSMVVEMGKAVREGTLTLHPAQN